MMLRLIGGYYRTGTWPDGRKMAMGFVRLKTAQRYGTRGINSADPYLRYLTGPIEWRPGAWIRRRPAAGNEEATS